MDHIKIVYDCELRPNGSWAPAFELCVVQGGWIQNLPRLSAGDPNLTFPTKEQAEGYSDAAARKWCSRNYPGWPVPLISREK